MNLKIILRKREKIRNEFKMNLIIYPKVFEKNSITTKRGFKTF